MRAFSEKQYRSLKAICVVAYDAVSGPTLFAQFTRVVVSQLSKYASFKEEDARSFIPVDVAIDLDQAAQFPHITGQMAALLGYRLVASAGADSSRRAVDETMAHEILAETMDVTKAILDARRDGRIDAYEHKLILREAHEAKAKLEMLIANMEGESR